MANSVRDWLTIACLLLPMSLSGCSSARSSLSSVTAIPVSARSETALEAAETVQAQPLYKQAEVACQKHHYLDAVHLLDQLIATHKLSSEELAFSQQQRLIGLKEAGRLPKNPPVSPPSAPLIARDADCGPRALAIVCQKLGIPASVDKLRQLAGTTAKGTSMAGLAKAVQALGLQAEGVQVSREALADVDPPCLAWINENHYVAVLSLSGDGEKATATIHDPNQPHEQTIAREQLLRLSGGYLLLMHR